MLCDGDCALSVGVSLMLVGICSWMDHAKGVSCMCCCSQQVAKNLF